MTPQGLAQNLNGRKVGANWMGKCPAHEDHDPSLAIREEGGKLLFHCHGGCAQGDVLDALKNRGLWPEHANQPYRSGSAKSGLTPASVPQDDPVPVEVIRRSLNAQGWNIAAEYQYGPLLRNVRFENPACINETKGRPEKTYRWEHLENGKWYSGDGGNSKPVYVNSICRQGGRFDCVLGVEGPNKAEAAAELGIPAFSFKNLNEESGKELVVFGRVVLWPDKDASGLKFADTAANLIGAHLQDVRMIAPPANLPDGGDIVDAREAGMDAADVRALMEGARRIWTGQTIQAVSDIPPISSFTSQKIDWIVDGLLISGTITVLSGDSGAGKSTVATGMLGAIAWGMPFVGRETQPRPVLILDRENPLSILAERFRRLGVSDGEHLRVWGGWCPDQPPDVDSPILTAWVARCNPKPVLMIDSLIAFNKGDENDAVATRAFFSSLRRLTDMGATVIILCHIGKSETAQDYRGSSDIKASCDIGYKLTSQGDGSRLSLLQLTAFKQRISVTPSLALRYVDGEFRAEDGDRHDTVEKRLRDLLVQNSGIQRAAFAKLAAECGLGRNVGREFLLLGVKNGDIRAEPGSKNATLHFWRGDSNIATGQVSR